MKPEDFLDPKNFDKITPDMFDELNAQIEGIWEGGCHGDCASCDSDCNKNAYPKFAKLLLAVTSGKGGTGKSTVTALLARNLAGRGLKVAVLDADLAGATMSLLLGAHGPVTGAEGKIDPAQVSDHLKLLSYDLINDDPTDPVLWPGADIFHMVDHLYLNGSWGTDNDVFLIDMPAGAGDVPINLFTAFPVDGTVIVGEPSELAVAPLQRCVAMTRMFLSAPVAYVENKSLDGGAHLAPRLDLGAKCVNFALPLSPELAAHDGEVTPAMAELADELAEYVVSLIPQK
jgi:Mrp family chromosome partitioning ATPase